ncbi:hypothetical protein [Pseudomonas sp. 460]|uniref:hypothetical protein n=1 Tax=Pseudomonas sp. 460 TaxID=2485142 RepID=UPI00104634A0|nr:hypothetical protein [Pseudomonas sp. 460]TCV51368.1 hypothetical protein EDB99_10734 [Pseudomonas sp. 460]
MVTVEKTPNVTFAVKLGLFLFVAIGLLADRVMWADQIVGRINLANVRIADVNCSASDWLEVVPGKDDQQTMRYRCGFMFWPLYHSGESLIATEALKNARS